MSENSSFKLIIEDDEGRRSVVPIDLDSVREGISIGRQEGNTIRLNERNVSRRHARFVRDPIGIFAEDLDSYNGVWINGDRIKGRQELHDGDNVRVGDFQLELRGEGLQRRVEETTQRTMLGEGSEVTRPDIRLEHAMNGGPLAPGVSGVGAPIGGQAGGVSNGAPHAEVQGQSRVDMPGSRTPTMDDDVSRPEPTALIRMDREEGDRRRDASGIAGQKAKLICVSTQFAGAEYEVDKTEVVIGRTDENDIPIDHRSVSRHHAKIVVNQRSYRIMDLKSANGTLVNGEEYAQTELKRGDLIELGHVKFRFLPPGATYDFNAEEITALRQASGGALPPAAQARITPPPVARETVPASDRDLGGIISMAPTAINEWSDELAVINSKKRIKPLIVAGFSALAVVLIGGIAIVAMNGRNSGTTTTASSGNREVQKIDTPNADQEAMRARAKTAMMQREWNEARKLADALLVLNPADPEAQDIKQRATDEIIGQNSLDRAVRAIEARNWDDAWRFLSEVPESTSAHTQSVSLRGQVRAGRVIAKIDETKKNIAAQQWVDARRTLGEINEMDPLSPELPALTRQITEGERAAGHETIADARDPTRPDPGRTKDKDPKGRDAKQAAREATREQASRETSTREQATRDAAAREQAQREAATREQATRDAAAREAAARETKPTPPPVLPTPTPPPQQVAKVTPTPPPPAPQPAPTLDAKGYYSAGLQALQTQETDKAIDLLDKCVKADTKYGMCYRALGIAYARQKNGPKAAKYYRMYLRVMPDAKDAKQVEELLKAYENGSP